MSTTRISRVRTRLALGSGVVVAMLISMTGVASAAGGSAAPTVAPSAAITSGAAPSGAGANNMAGDASEFDGYVGYVGADGKSAGAAAVDAGVVKKDKLVAVAGTANDDHTRDVPGQAGAQSAPDTDGVRLIQPTGPDSKSVSAVRSALKSADKARVIVLMKATLSKTAGRSAAGLSAQRADSAEAHADLAATLAGTGSSKLSEYPLLPAAVYNVTSDGLDALLADPAVASVSLDGQVSTELASSTAVIQSNVLNAAGVLGNNFEGSTTGRYQVAIIDTGVDNQHNAFTGRIVSQACFTTNNTCLGGTNSSVAPGSGDECTSAPGCDHGTHVASIAAGATFPGGHEGVAQGAGIVAVKVFQGPGPNAAFTSIDAGLQRVLTLKNTTNPNIVSVNLSIGTDGLTFSPGDPACNNLDPATGILFGQLQAAGVAVLVAAGNDGRLAQMSFPGCAPNAFAIGATDDFDNPAGFSNASTDMKWWAPGVGVDAAVPTGNNHGVKSGTSMATPHVTGAFALLRECISPSSETPQSKNEVVAELNASGPNVTRSGITRKRINVLDAATSTVNNNDFANAEVFAGNGPINDFDWTVCSDTEPGEPGPFSLDNGNWWAWTPSTTGTATISTQDGGGNVTTFDTTLAVYTGNSLGSLNLVAADDDSGGNLKSLVTFPVNGGTTYRIKVDGFAAANGKLNLHIQNGPPPTCVGTPATIVGTAGNDVINGTAGNDVIVAGAGNDTINGGGGNDMICGDAGNDRILGGTGDDQVWGGSGADVISGGDGNDLLIGNPGFGSNDDSGDAIYGEAGNDTLDGWFGNDTLSGGPGNDSIGGFAGIDTATFASSPAAVTANLTTNTAVGEGSDTFVDVENLVGSAFNDVFTGNALANVLVGNNGNDRLDGLAGNDVLQGLAGNDVLRGRAGNDVFDGGAGIDWAVFDASPAPVQVNLTTGTATGEGADTLVADENVHGSNFNDVIRGNAGPNTLLGSNGNDYVNGLAGNDIVQGDAGIDRVYGDVGNDLARGGVGNDTIVDGGPGIDRVYGDAGNDLVQGGTGNDITVDGGDGIDRVYGGDGNDVVRGGTGNDAIVNGDAGNDRVYGDAGNDLVRGGLGNDPLVSGDAGNDHVLGDGGLDHCNGGAGLDVGSPTCEFSVGIP